jgi:hypothetical protein
MSWIDILKKNDQEFEISIDKDIEIIEEIKIIYDPNIKDIDEEYEKIYSLKIHDILFDFKELIKEDCLPFLNNKSTNDLFFEFIKFNSNNYYKLKEIIINENQEYLQELHEEEEQEKYESNLEFD